MEAAMIDIVTKNVKQIGTPTEEDRIYICDEAYRRIHTTSFDEKRVFVFMGHTENYNGKYATFIEATIPVVNIEFKQGLPVWNNKTWSSVFSEIKRKYEEMIIVGWAVDYKGYTPKLTPELEFIHKEQFGGVHQVFMMSDSIENEECFYVNKGKRLVQKAGFFIYYKAREKKENPNVDIELPEEFEGTATKEARNHNNDNILEKESASAYRERYRQGSYREVMNMKPQHKKESKLINYALTAAVAAIVVAFGITIINGRSEGYSKVNSVEAVNNMEDAINLIQNTETIPSEANSAEDTNESDSAETVAIPVENVEGDISGN